MKRPIFVRPLSDAERETLEAGLRSPDAFTLRRCQILLASSRGERSSFGAPTSATGGAIQLFQAFGPPGGRRLPEAFRRAGDSGKAPG